MTPTMSETDLNGEISIASPIADVEVDANIETKKPETKFSFPSFKLPSFGRKKQKEKDNSEDISIEAPNVDKLTKPSTEMNFDPSATTNMDPSAAVELETDVPKASSEKAGIDISLPKLDVELQNPEADLSFPSFHLPSFGKKGDSPDQDDEVTKDDTDDISVIPNLEIDINTPDIESKIPLEQEGTSEVPSSSAPAVAVEVEKPEAKSNQQQTDLIDPASINETILPLGNVSEDVPEPEFAATKPSANSFLFSWPKFGKPKTDDKSLDVDEMTADVSVEDDVKLDVDVDVEEIDPQVSILIPTQHLEGNTEKDIDISIPSDPIPKETPDDISIPELDIQTQLSDDAEEGPEIVINTPRPSKRDIDSNFGNWIESQVGEGESAKNIDEKNPNHEEKSKGIFANIFKKKKSPEKEKPGLGKGLQSTVFVANIPSAQVNSPLPTKEDVAEATTPAALTDIQVSKLSYRSFYIPTNAQILNKSFIYIKSLFHLR